VAESRRLTILYRLKKIVMFPNRFENSFNKIFLSFRDETLLVFKSELFLVSVLMRS